MSDKDNNIMDSIALIIVLIRQFISIILPGGMFLVGLSFIYGDKFTETWMAFGKPFAIIVFSIFVLFFGYIFKILGSYIARNVNECNLKNKNLTKRLNSCDIESKFKELFNKELFNKELSSIEDFDLILTTIRSHSPNLYNHIQQFSSLVELALSSLCVAFTLIIFSIVNPVSKICILCPGQSVTLLISILLYLFVAIVLPFHVICVALTLIIFSIVNPVSKICNLFPDQSVTLWISILLYLFVVIVLPFHVKRLAFEELLAIRNSFVTLYKTHWKIIKEQEMKPSSQIISHYSIKSARTAFRQVRKIRRAL